MNTTKPFGLFLERPTPLYVEILRSGENGRSIAEWFGIVKWGSDRPGAATSYRS
jgi:hypothetical protein